MIPVIAIVGRPNVGKSTLFNRLTKSRDALVADFSGLTRDRQYGEGVIDEKHFIVIDTGGIAEGDADIEGLMTSQSEQAIEESNTVLFMVDGRAGLTAADITIANQLRPLSKKIYLVVNKVDGLDPDVALADFYQLGFTDHATMAASHGRGVSSLISKILEDVPIQDEEDDEQTGIKLAIVGRPNVGKSTLVNRMLGEERVIVFDMPGTTRDSIFIPLERQSQRYTLIDTAGVRRRARVSHKVEKFSVIKTLQAIEAAHVVVLLLDATEGVTEQDLRLLGFILQAGKCIIIAINKWDNQPQSQKSYIKKELDRRLQFAKFAKILYISALYGTGVGDIFKFVDRAYKSANKKITTSTLTAVLEDTLIAHQPPMVHGRRIKIRYAHIGGHNPPLFVLHGNQTKSLPKTYLRYLENAFRKAFNLIGTPIRFELKEGDNPYKDKKNKLTPTQQRKRKRMMQHVKKRAKK